MEKLLHSRKYFNSTVDKCHPIKYETRLLLATTYRHPFVTLTFLSARYVFSSIASKIISLTKCYTRTRLVLKKLSENFIFGILKRNLDVEQALVEVSSQKTQTSVGQTHG